MLQTSKTDNPYNAWWVGLNELGEQLSLTPSNGQYFWSDQTPAEYFYWAPGEPNDGGLSMSEGCVQMYKGNGKPDNQTNEWSLTS